MWTELSQGHEAENGQRVMSAEECDIAAPAQRQPRAKLATTTAMFVILLAAACLLGWSSTSAAHKASSMPVDNEIMQAVEYTIDPYVTADLYKPNYKGKDGMWCVGLNAVGLDLGATLGRKTGWTVPSHDAIRYFHKQGATCFRLPISWERLQSSLGSEEVDAVDGTDGVVDLITKTLGAYVIIDPHNNDEGLKYNNKDATRSDFVNLWKAIAKKWGDNDKCIFGLYNEPRYGFEAGVEGYFNPDVLDRDGTVIEYWRRWMQAAINEIRKVGAKNLILVPGLHWTGCADWGGNGWWGETLDGHANAGNSRLAALTDPEDLIAYDVHQYMDTRYTGQHKGCRGHDLNYFCKDYAGCTGADRGLEQTIAWAKRYNKKLMMTEIGSWPLDGTEDDCQTRMYEYLQRMHESGVFIGYQVWQFGCEGCDGDQWTKKPLNLDWYRIKEFADMAKCSSDNEDCTDTKCCKEWGSACTVLGGSKGQTEWHPTCKSGGESTSGSKVLGSSHCSAEHEDCRESMCCKDADMICFEKNSWWAHCASDCVPGIRMSDEKEHQTPWSCKVMGTQTTTTIKGATTQATVMTTEAPRTEKTTSMARECSESHHSCMDTLCCKDSDMRCFLKNEHWASCRADCEPGLHEADALKYRTPWACEELRLGGVDGRDTPALEI